MFYALDNVMYLFDCAVCFSTAFTIFCYIMNLYFGPAALHYIINNILSYKCTIEELQL